MIEFLAPIFAVIFLGGFVKGLNGFGISAVATPLLTFFVSPIQAVVIVIAPLLASNLDLVFELDRSQVKPCINRFKNYLAGAGIGTVLGMLAIGSINSNTLKGLLGIAVIIYSISRVGSIEERIGDITKALKDLDPSKDLALGFVSGIIFGVSNIGIQTIVYLESLELDRHTFLGVIAMIFIGLSGLRMGISYFLGLYGTTGLFTVSILASVPGLVGLETGKRLGNKMSNKITHRITVASIGIIGTLMVLKSIGLGIV